MHIPTLPPAFDGGTDPSERATTRGTTVADPLSNVPIDWTYKGVAPAAEGTLPAALGEAGEFLFDDRVLMPTAVLKESTLRANSQWMRRFLALTGVKLAPHGKTTMAPDLFRLQLADGAWGMTAATAQHVRAYRRFGVQRILMANQLVGAGAIGWVVEELERDPGFDFYCLADSVKGVQALAREAAAKRLSRPIQVLIEVGRSGGRAGVRTIEDGLHVAHAVSALAPYVALVGVETFEGVFQTAADAESQACAMLADVVSLARACDERGLFRERILLSAGGSAFYDIAASILSAAGLSLPVEVILRSGCYLTQDDGIYNSLFARLKTRVPQVTGFGHDLQPALQVWAHVISRPEPGRLICGLGKRDVGDDIHPPRPIAWARCGDRAARPAPEGLRVVSLNDQHACVLGPADMPLQVGDFVGFGVSHPCTTFDKWRALLTVGDDYRLRGLVRTYF